MSHAPIVGGLPEQHNFNFQAYYLSGLVMRTLRVHYSQRREFLLPGLQHLYWSPDNRHDGGENDPQSMRIDMSSQWNPSRAGSRPALLCRMNDYNIQKPALAAGMHTSPGFNYLDGRQYFTRIIVGSMNVFCLSSSAGEAELLTVSTQVDLQHWSKSLRKRAGLAALDTTKVLMPKPLREKPTYLAGVITLGFGYFWTYIRQPLEPKLARYELQLQPVKRD